MIPLKEAQIIEQEVKKYITDPELKKYFEIRSDIRWRSAQYYAAFDIVLYQKDNIYAIVEVKSSLTPTSFENAKRQIANALMLTQCRFGIITDGETYFFTDAVLGKIDYEKMEFNQIVTHLINPQIISQTNEGITNIKNALKKCFSDAKVKSIIKDIHYDDKQGCYTFVSLKDEQNFFLKIVGNWDIKKRIYRYVPLDTLFLMLNKETYRMSGIVGMNDKSETDYFDNGFSSGTTGSSIRDLNKTFLSSCCALKDYLTMWRLYGDDGKGVCLEYEILPEEMRLDDFILAPVDYAEKRGKHQARKMLKQLSDANLRFSELYKWKHFFKPYDYNVEEEIRLMFIDNGSSVNGVINRDWVKTWSHSIINPIVDFKLNSPSFPIQLKRIILGPKMPERETNKSQLEDLISVKGYSIEVTTSGIKNYR